MTRKGLVQGDFFVVSGGNVCYNDFEDSILCQTIKNDGG